MRSHRCPSWAILVLMSVLPILSACGSDQAAPVPGSLILVGGDAQTAQVGTALGQMLTGEVRDDTGAPTRCRTHSVTRWVATSRGLTDGLEKGDDGELCDFNFNVAITVKPDGDPNEHEPFIQLTTVTMITGRLTSPGVIEFTSGSSTLWSKTTGAVGTDGTFTTTGTGLAATFPGVQVTFDGTVIPRRSFQRVFAI